MFLLVFLFAPVLLFGALVPLCFLFFSFSFLMLSRVCLSSFFGFFLRKKQSGKGARVHCRHRHGQLEQLCSSVVFLVLLCVVVALFAVTPQACGTRVLMYMGAG